MTSDQATRWLFIPNIETGKCKTTAKDNNYYEANKFYRGVVLTQYVKSDPCPLPRPTETIGLDPQIRPICPAGGAQPVRWSANAIQCPAYLWQNQIQQ